MYYETHIYNIYYKIDAQQIYIKVSEKIRQILINVMKLYVYQSK